MSKKIFEVVYDAHYGIYLVRECSHAYAASMVVANYQGEFETKTQALEQVRRLTKHQAKGNMIETKHMWTTTSRRLLIRNTVQHGSENSLTKR